MAAPQAAVPPRETPPRRRAGETTAALHRPPKGRLAALPATGSSPVLVYHDGREADRTAMDLGVAESRDSIDVVGCGVALVTVEPVPRVLAVQLAHQPVP